MCKTLRVFASLLLLQMLGLMSGCDNLLVPVGTSGDSVRREVTIPYVEEVSVPETMHVNEVAAVSVRYSAALMPGIFTTSGFVWGSGSELEAVGGDLGTLLDPRSFFLVPARHPGGAPPGDTVTFNIIATHPGTYTVRLGTTKSRETGGTSVETVVTPGFIFPAGRDPFIYGEEYVIEVLPAP
jgi:hypothetical protein